MLWIDSHRPRSFEDDSNIYKDCEQSRILISLCDGGNMPHLLIYGPPGSGKTTLVYCILHRIYGSGALKMKSEMNEFKTNSNKIIELSVLSSSFHIDISPSDVKRNDRLVVQDLIKSLAQSCSLGQSEKNNFKVVVIRYANKLSSDAQHALRRTMEKYIATCRVILICENLSGMTDPVKSRCLCIRNPAPSPLILRGLLKEVARCENAKFCTDDIIEKTILHSNSNIRKALLIMQSVEFQRSNEADDYIFLTDWESLIKHTSDMIVKDQRPKQLLEIRNKLYSLLARCISPDTILKNLLYELCKVVDKSLNPSLYFLATSYSHRMNNGDKPIIHLEAFVASAMVIINEFIVDICEIEMNSF